MFVRSVDEHLVVTDVEKGSVAAEDVSLCHFCTDFLIYLVLAFLKNTLCDGKCQAADKQHAYQPCLPL